MDELIPGMENYLLTRRVQEELLNSPTSTINDQNLASEFYRRLVEWINKFDESLDGLHEVGVRLVSFGQTVVFHLEDISYWNPSLISFIGKTKEDEPVELIQHVSQISILLMKLERLDPTKPKKKIGFVEEKDEEEEK